MAWTKLPFRRETGIQRQHDPVGTADLYSRMVSPFDANSPVGSSSSTNTEPHGGIFGLDYHPDGSLLAAACENSTVLFVDPHTYTKVATVPKAHRNCVNTVKFLDSRILASCSDDHTVRLWDLRMLRSQVSTLIGHKSWVKNIEYIPEKALLISSSFDGFVYSWDLNSNCEDLQCHRLFYTPGLMRMCITPMCDKMIMSTQWGYLLVVHNIHLDTLSEDFTGFKPNMYWLMMKSGALFASAEVHGSAFTRRRNRAEIIVDFPETNDPESVTSITAHPQGWAVLSRNVNCDEQTEWTCLHDIQLPPSPPMLSDGITNVAQADHNDAPAPEDSPPDQLDYLALLPATSQPQRDTGRPVRRPNESNRRATRNVNSVRRRFRPSETDYRSIRRVGSSPQLDTPRLQEIPRKHSRLLYYADEPHLGRGYIKEVAFSSCGRVIASPCGYCIRLLSLDAECRDLSQTESAFGAKRAPARLHELSTIVTGRQSVVLCTAFSPTHPQLASGCLMGKVTFHNPRL